MQIRSEAEVRADIEATLKQRGLTWEPNGSGGILVGFFQTVASGKTEADIINTLKDACIPYEPKRGGCFVSAYEVGQMARKGWEAPRQVMA